MIFRVFPGGDVAAMAWGASSASNAAGASSGMRSLARFFSRARGVRGSADTGGALGLGLQVSGTPARSVLWCFGFAVTCPATAWPRALSSHARHRVNTQATNDRRNRRQRPVARSRVFSTLHLDTRDASSSFDARTSLPGLDQKSGNSLRLGLSRATSTRCGRSRGGLGVACTTHPSFSKTNHI